MLHISGPHVVDEELVLKFAIVEEEQRAGDRTMAMMQTIQAVIDERRRQEDVCAAKRRVGRDYRTCADRTMSFGDKLAVLMEEVGEVAREWNEHRGEDADLRNLKTELIQVAAVAAAWAESL